MGRKQTHAKDGTLRAAEPQQDAQGNWYCPACGRASGFKSKMAVLGHLRGCRPGNPNLDHLLEGGGAPPEPSAPSAAGFSTADAAAIKQGMAEMRRELHTLATNHISHMGLANATAKAPPPPAPPSAFAIGDWVKWGGLAALGVYVVGELADRRPAVQPVAWPPPSESTLRMQKQWEGTKAARCAAQWSAKAAGQDVEIDSDCLDPEETAKRSVAKGFGRVKQIAGVVKDMAAMAAAGKKLLS